MLRLCTIALDASHSAASHRSWPSEANRTTSLVLVEVEMQALAEPTAREHSSHSRRTVQGQDLSY